MSKMNPRVLVVFILVVFCHLMFNQSLQLHYDEAYYWVWSKNLQLSYFDHPPMIAYLIRLTTWFSDHEFFVRLAGVICATLSILLIYKTSFWLFDQKTADISVLLALAWPLLEGNFFITTIDAPLLLFWSLTLYCLVRGFIGESRSFILLAGVALGLALLSKYTAILILPGVLVFLLLSPRKRQFLLKAEVYLAFLVAMLVFSPVIIWNYQHDFVSFKFQFSHGVASLRQFNLASLSDYVGSTLGAANPVISLGIVYYIIKARRQILGDDRLLLLVAIFVGVVLFFGYNSCYKFQEANWVAPGFISGIIFLAAMLAAHQVKWVQRLAISLVLLLLPLIKLPEVFVPRAYQARIPAINAFKGNQELYQRLKLSYLRPGDIVFACDYGNASRGWYYLGQGRVYVPVNFDYVHSYAQWEHYLPSKVQHAIYYCDDNNPLLAAKLHASFKVVESVGVIRYHDSFVNNKLYIYRLSN